MAGRSDVVRGAEAVFRMIGADIARVQGGDALPPVPRPNEADLAVGAPRWPAGPAREIGGRRHGAPDARGRSRSPRRRPLERVAEGRVVRQRGDGGRDHHVHAQFAHRYTGPPGRRIYHSPVRTQGGRVLSARERSERNWRRGRKREYAKQRKQRMLQEIGELRRHIRRAAGQDPDMPPPPPAHGGRGLPPPRSPHGRAPAAPPRRAHGGGAQRAPVPRAQAGDGARQIRGGLAPAAQRFRMDPDERALLTRYSADIMPDRIVMRLPGQRESVTYLSTGAAVLAVNRHRREEETRAQPNLLGGGFVALDSAGVPEVRAAVVVPRDRSSPPRVVRGVAGSSAAHAAERAPQGRALPLRIGGQDGNHERGSASVLGAARPSGVPAAPPGFAPAARDGAHAIVPVARAEGEGGAQGSAPVLASTQRVESQDASPAAGARRRGASEDSAARATLVGRAHDRGGADTARRSRSEGDSSRCQTTRAHRAPQTMSDVVRGLFNGTLRRGAPRSSSLGHDGAGDGGSAEHGASGDGEAADP